MISPPVVITVPAQAAAIIALDIPMAEMQRAFAEGCQELYGTLAAQGLAPAGPLYAYHHRRPNQTFHFDLSVPINGTVAATGRVQPSLRPAGRVARTVYSGPYEGLAGAWGDFMAWIAEQGLQTTPQLWEAYVLGPMESSDVADWRTELTWPLL